MANQISQTKLRRIIRESLEGSADVDAYKEIEDLTLEAIANVRNLSIRLNATKGKFPRKFNTPINQVYEKLNDLLVDIVEKIDELT